MIVAIDGPAGAGKSSVALAVASRLGFLYVDTGAIYRALAWTARALGVDWADDVAVAHLARRLRVRFALDGEINRVWVAVDDAAEREVTELIRSAQISEGTSVCSAIPAVREALLDLQRELGRRADCVLEGRDIGTVVFPAAEVKIFLTASPIERARRRREQWLESAAEPRDVPDLDTIVAEIRRRDERDRNREVAPLKPARDAVELDTTDLAFDEVVDRIAAAVDARRP